MEKKFYICVMMNPGVFVPELVIETDAEEVSVDSKTNTVRLDNGGCCGWHTIKFPKEAIIVIRQEEGVS